MVRPRGCGKIPLCRSSSSAAQHEAHLGLIVDYSSECVLKPRIGNLDVLYSRCIYEMTDMYISCETAGEIRQTGHLFLRSHDPSNQRQYSITMRGTRASNTIMPDIKTEFHVNRCPCQEPPLRPNDSHPELLVQPQEYLKLTEYGEYNSWLPSQSILSTRDLHTTNMEANPRIVAAIMGCSWVGVFSALAVGDDA
ncbi:hypothetical protein BKA61DRAFT_604946 [Leptodontidium sp. MPI-SDFR-AT-0119]|nr:hypothetical protein BKA61DRAFT_604946 [Leptodontidium sp. MPI-SDFR-AT-0119]